MGRRRFTPEFTATDLRLRENVLRKWIKNVEAHRAQASPGQGRMRPDDAEVARLMRSEGLGARRRRRRLPLDSGVRPTSSIAPNLLERQFAARQSPCVCHSRRSQGRCVRLRRAVLQSSATALAARLPESRGIRKCHRLSLGRCPRKPGNPAR